MVAIRLLARCFHHSHLSWIPIKKMPEPPDWSTLGEFTESIYKGRRGTTPIYYQ